MEFDSLTDICLDKQRHQEVSTFIWQCLLFALLSTVKCELNSLKGVQMNSFEELERRREDGSIHEFCSLLTDTRREVGLVDY